MFSQTTPNKFRDNATTFKECIFKRFKPTCSREKVLEYGCICELHAETFFNVYKVVDELASTTMSQVISRSAFSTRQTTLPVGEGDYLPFPYTLQISEGDTLDVLKPLCRTKDESTRIIISSFVSSLFTRIQSIKYTDEEKRALKDILMCMFTDCSIYTNYQENNKYLSYRTTNLALINAGWLHSYVHVVTYQNGSPKIGLIPMIKLPLIYKLLFKYMDVNTVHLQRVIPLKLKTSEEVEQERKLYPIGDRSSEGVPIIDVENAESPRFVKSNEPVLIFNGTSNKVSRLRNTWNVTRNTNVSTTILLSGDRYTTTDRGFLYSTTADLFDDDETNTRVVMCGEYPICKDEV